MSNLDLINKDFENKGYRLSETHYENGKSMHSDQYFFAKKFLQNSENCDELSILLKNKIEELNFEEGTTFICYRTYLALLLKRTLSLMGTKNYKFEIIDQVNDKFEWQKKPRGKISNLVIILPISCTCATYFRIKRFLTDDFKKNQLVRIDDNFISIFLIMDQYLYSRKNTITVIGDFESNKITKEEKEKREKLYMLYKNFNWKTVTPSQVHFALENNLSSKKPVGNPIVKLSSNLYLPESCPICFPTDVTQEKPLFPTHETYETPGLIFGFPNFKNFENRHAFDQLFYEEGKKWNIQFYGNRSINNANHISYIKGNEFYIKNKPLIIDYFLGNIKNVIEKSAFVVFITAENKQNSSFLEDLTNTPLFKKKKTIILRFQHDVEFIDNFISLHSDMFSDEATKVIYFEEIITVGNTFKLVSDYIKHSKYKNKPLTDESRHGIDMVLTLIDRTSWHTYKEIIRKLSSEKNTPNQQFFLSFYTLNVPVIHAEHLGDPIRKRLEDLKRLKEYCCLDYLKLTINSQILKHTSEDSPHDVTETLSQLKYFPFARIYKETKIEAFMLYKDFDYERLNLIKLWVAHEINCLLAEKEYQHENYFDQYKMHPHDFIDHVIWEIMNRKGDEIRELFVLKANRDSSYRNFERETVIIEEIIIKILASPPFTYYKNIYNAIFDYCLYQVNNILGQYTSKRKKNSDENKYMTFEDFRRFKFFIRLSVDLNSNFIISEKFIKVLNQFFDTDLSFFTNTYEHHRTELKKKLLNQEIDLKYYERAEQQINYILYQISSFFPYLLFCYKDLVVKNSYRSIKLEELINSTSLLPEQLRDPNIDDDISKLILDNYFQFTGMIKAENVIIIMEMIEYTSKSTSLKDTFIKYSGQIGGRKKILDSIKRNYFRHKKNDTYFANTIDFLTKSRFLNGSETKGTKGINTKINTQKYYEVRDSLCKAIYSAYELKQKTNPQKGENSLDDDIKTILDDFVDILNNGKTDLEYTLLIEYQKGQKGENSTNSIFAISKEGDIKDNEKGLDKKNGNKKETRKIGDIVNLNSNGLISNMLSGLYSEINDAKNLQTLVSCARKATGKMVAYKEHYYDKAGKERNFDELYNLDLYSYKNDEGLKMLKNAEMAIFIRLTDFSNVLPNQNQTQAEALLVITSKEKSNIPNYLDFMSNEKVRLLMVLKDMLLRYLQKQFDNDTFTEIIKNRTTEKYRKSLKHGINEYTNSICDIIDNVSSELNHNFDYDLEVLDIIIDAIKGQLMDTEDAESETITITQRALSNKINLLFSSSIFKYTVDLDRVKLDLNFETLDMNAAIFKVAFPEIIINMKKYSLRCSGHDFCISFDSQNNAFHFINHYEKNINDEEEDHKGGLWMIKNILNEHQLGELSWESKSNSFETILNLNPKI